MNGREFFLVEVIAMILKYLKDKFLTVECIGSTQGKLKMDDFKWAITVPAMWKARGKQMMRQAAYKVNVLAMHTGRIFVCINCTCSACM